MGVGVGVSHACGARLTVEQRAHGMGRRRQSFKLIMMSRGEALARSACWYCVCVHTHTQSTSIWCIEGVVYSILVSCVVTQLTANVRLDT